MRSSEVKSVLLLYINGDLIDIIIEMTYKCNKIYEYFEFGYYDECKIAIKNINSIKLSKDNKRLLFDGFMLCAFDKKYIDIVRLLLNNTKINIEMINQCFVNHIYKNDNLNMELVKLLIDNGANDIIDVYASSKTINMSLFKYYIENTNEKNINIELMNSILPVYQWADKKSIKLFDLVIQRVVEKGMGDLNQIFTIVISYNIDNIELISLLIRKGANNYFEALRTLCEYGETITRLNF